jgi:hypothetical protein
MVTDPALFRCPYYQSVHDTPDKLNYDVLTRLVRGLEAVIGGLVG